MINITPFTVGGSISGLVGSVVLQDNGGDNLTASTNGNFVFATRVINGGPYNVAVRTQPTGQTCSVSNGSGTISGNITNVAVTCANNLYAVGGSVSGLTGTVVLQNNSGDNLTVAANGSFTFATTIANGNTYSVSVLTQPTGQACSVSAGAGTVSGSNVTNVAVVCATNTYNVGGTVSGLAGFLVLQNNNGDNITVAANGAFTFATQVANGSPYSVTVLTHPAGQGCSVASGTGTISLANVTNVAITCATNTYTIGGTVTGLSGSLVLQDNGGDNLTILANGAFTFATAVAYGNTYNITVLTQPAGQNCIITGGSGTVTSNATNNAAVSCSNLYAIGGILNGLATSNSITVANNGTNNLTLAANGAFAFPGMQPSGSSYNLSIVTLPINQPCSYTYGAGTVIGTNVTSINLFCGAAAVNAWTAMASLTTARYSHTATVLPDGKVLVAGGWSGTGSMSNAEIYDSATNTWLSAGILLSARNFHSATLLHNGKVLVVGGWSGAAFASIKSAELYDPATNTWSSAGLLATARRFHTATLLPNGKVLVAGGLDNFAYLSSAELYDPSTNTWSAAGNLSTPRYNYTATLLQNGKVLAAGGSSGSAFLASAELYDPSTNTWSVAGSLGSERYNHSATLLPSGKVLAAGGQGAVYFASAELYDPATNTWSAAGSLVTARDLHTATLLPSGRVLVTGGSSTGFIILGSAELYDPATNTWSMASSLSTVRKYHVATLLQSGKLLVSGGVGSAVLTNAELYW